MNEPANQRPDLLRAAEAAAPVDSVDVVADSLRRRFGAKAVSFLIVDLTGRAVIRLTTAGHVEAGTTPDHIDLFDSIYERVVRTQQTHQEPVASGQRVIAPVTNRGDAIGLLELTLPTAPPESVVTAVSEAAHTLAYIVIANQRFTDLYTWGRRTTPLTLLAEIQHQLLPLSLSCEAAEFAVSAQLEPSAAVSGDSFDYTLDRETLHLAVTDPMGHDIDAALIATILLRALRGARRAGADTGEQARLADQALSDHGRGHATGQLLRINLSDGETQFINAGHPWPVRMRGGTIEEVAIEIDKPFGMPFSHAYRVQSLDLRPGDRLLMLTDGMLEYGARKVDLGDILRKTRDMHPRQAVLALTTAVLDANDGQLRDDATAMFLDWHGPATHQPPRGSASPA